MALHLRTLQDGPGANQLFIRLRDVVCGSDARLAYHMWVACAGSHKWCCGLHLDDLDLGLLLNMVCSLGVDEQLQVVQLHGSLLMVVVCVSTDCLLRAPCDLFGSNVQFASDAVGNIILLEPHVADVRLPAGHSKADEQYTITPTTCWTSR